MLSFAFLVLMLASCQFLPKFSSILSREIQSREYLVSKLQLTFFKNTLNVACFESEWTNGYVKGDDQGWRERDDDDS